MPFKVEKLELADMKASDVKECSKSARVCLKFTLVFLNIPVVVFSAISLGIGVWILMDDGSFFDLTADVLDLKVLDQQILRQGAVVMTAAGGAMIAISGLGVIGALAMNSCVLVFYVVPLVVLLTLEAAIMVLAVVFKSEWEMAADKFLGEKFVTGYGSSGNSSQGLFTQAFDMIQRKIDCCGWDSRMDYQQVDRAHWNTTLANGDHRKVPDSCCKGDNSTSVLDCVVAPYNSSAYIMKGCRQAVCEQLEIYQWVIIGVTTAVLAIQLLLLIVALTSIVHNVSHKYSMR